MHDVVMHCRYGKLYLVFFLLSLVSMSAGAVQCSLASGATTIPLNTPGNLTVPASAADDTVIWTSPPQSIRVRCWDAARNGENLSFWLNPLRQTLAPGLVVGLIYNGQTFWANPVASGALTRIMTGEILHRSPDERIFNISYSIVLAKKGTPPANGSSSFANFNVFQIDGARGLNTDPGMSTLRQQISGSVVFSVGGTCNLSVGGGSNTVQLPRVSLRAFTQVGDIAGTTPFSLGLSNCSDTVRSARFIFDGTADATDSRYFSNTGGATGIALRLNASDGATVITPNSPTNEQTVAVSNKQATLNLAASYVRVSTVTAGSVMSRALISVIYQ